VTASFDGIREWVDSNIEYSLDEESHGVMITGNSHLKRLLLAPGIAKIMPYFS